MGLEIAGALCTLYPKIFLLDKTLYSIGSQEVINALKNRKDPQWILLQWQAPLEEFLDLRSKYLLY
jgi:hypothetical protein